MSIDAGLDTPIRGGGSGAGSFRAKIKGPAEAAPTTWSKWARSKKWIVSHESVGYKIWWSYTLLCVFATLVTLPLQIAFFPNSPSLNATSWLMDSSFALDLLINFRLSFRDPETDEIVTAPRMIAWRYLKGLFLPDLVSIVPFGTFGGSDFLVLLGFLRFLRLRRVMQLFRILEHYEGLDYFSVCVGKFAFLLAVNCHTAGCVMWWLASLGSFGETTWVGTQHPDLPFQDPSSQYVTCMYWALVTTTTVGYGDFSPVSEVERLAAGLWMLFNLGVTAYIVGVVASLATKSDEETAAYRGEVAELNGYAKRHGLPEALINTMHRALKLQYGSAASGAQDGAFEARFPGFIASRARNLRHRPLLAEIALLAGKEDESDDEVGNEPLTPGTIGSLDSSSSRAKKRASSARFITAFAARVTEEVLIDGARVLEKGELAPDAYVLSEGRAEVLVQEGDGGPEWRVLSCSRGAVLGAEGFFLANGGGPMPWTVRIVGGAKVLRLSAADRNDLFEAFPVDGHRISMRVGKLAESLKKRADKALEETRHQATIDSGLDVSSRGRIRRLTRTVSSMGSIGATSFQNSFGSRRSKSFTRVASIGENAQAASTTLDGSGDSSFSKGHRMTSVATSDASYDKIDSGGGERLRLKRRKALEHFSKLCSELEETVAAQMAREEQALAAQLCDFAARNMLAQVRQQLRVAPLNSIPPDYDGRSPLHLAAAEGHLEMCKLLAAEGANLESSDRFERTPLFEACIGNRAEVVTFLRERGAAIGMKNAGARLCKAAFDGEMQLLKLFLLAGMDPLLSDYNAQTPLHVACSEGNTPMARLLLGHGQEMDQAAAAAARASALWSGSDGNSGTARLSSRRSRLVGRRKTAIAHLFTSENDENDEDGVGGGSLGGGSLGSLSTEALSTQDEGGSCEGGDGGGPVPLPSVRRSSLTVTDLPTPTPSTEAEPFSPGGTRRGSLVRAMVMAEDRWGHTPYSEAVRVGGESSVLVNLLREAIDAAPVDPSRPKSRRGSRRMSGGRLDARIYTANF